MAGLILVLCIFIICNWGKPCNLLGTRKIELGTNGGVKQIRLSIDELLDPLLANFWLPFTA